MFSRVAIALRECVNSGFRKLGSPLTWARPCGICGTNCKIEVGFPLLAAHLTLTTARLYSIEMNATDGVIYDPLYLFVRNFGWRSIMVEPISEALAALPRNCAAFRDVALIEIVIGPAEGQGATYSVEMSGREVMVMSLQSSFSRDVLQ